MGERIKQLRAEKGWSQSDLAREARLSLRTIQKVEAGIGNPTLDTLEAIAGALGKSVAQLVTDHSATRAVGA